MALAVDRRRVQAQAQGDVGHEQHALGEQVAVGAGQRELIGRLVEAGEGVLVTAEGEAERLEERHHRTGRKIRRAIERHVLEVVREPLGRLRLVERAAAHVQPDAHAPLGIAMRPDDVAQAVGQPARRQRGVGRQRLVGRGRGVGRDTGRQQRDQRQQGHEDAHPADPTGGR